MEIITNFNCLIIEKEKKIQAMQIEVKNSQLDLNQAQNELIRYARDFKSQKIKINKLEVGISM